MITSPQHRRSAWRERRTRGKLTVVVIPGHGASLYQWRISVWMLALLGLGCLSLLGWASYVVGRNAHQRADLAQAASLRQTDIKVAMDLAQGRDALLQVAGLEDRLRGMLKYKSEKSLIRSSLAVGPTEEDVTRLAADLQDTPDQAAGDIEPGVTALLKAAQAREQSVSEVLNYVEHQRTRLDSRPRGWPVHGWISSGFGPRVDPVSGRAGFHTGVDIANDTGTPVHCTADGRVGFAGWDGGYGKLVVVEHGHGFSTYYGHLSEIKTAAGAELKRGAVVGLMGATGNTTGPHVHYEIRLFGAPVNPLAYMQPAS